MIGVTAVKAIKEEIALIIDLCVFVSLFCKIDPNHEKAMEIWRELFEKRNRVIIPALALPEVCGAIRRLAGKRFAYEARKEIMEWIESNIMLVEELTMERAIKTSEIAMKFGIKGGDAFFVLLAKEMSAKLLIFDEELKRKIGGPLDKNQR